MYDREGVERYDRRIQRALSQREGPLVEVRDGFFRRARVLPESDERPFDEQVEVAIAGAGPSGLLMARLLSQRGHRVVVLEQEESLPSHTCLNLSREEFQSLVDTRALDEAAFRTLVLGDFDRGVFRLHDSASGRQQDFDWNRIYNISLDERRLLELLAGGIEVRLGHESRLERVSGSGAYVEWSRAGRRGCLKAELFIDARGWTSPLARAANGHLDAPFVLEIVSARTDRELPRELSAPARPIGIHAATYDAEVETSAGKVQPILERFSDAAPNVKPAELITSFVATPQVAPLAPLVDDLLPHFARVATGFAEAQVARSYFGHIPGHRPARLWERFPLQTSAGDRTLLLGTAARQMSTLTGAAFGPQARNAGRMAREISAALAEGDLSFRRLKRIDIDRKERLAQDIEALFAPIMLLDSFEKPGSVNQDWLAFMRASNSIDHDQKNAAFRDQLSLSTLHTLLGLCLREPRLVAMLARNNHGQVGMLAGVLLSVYFGLLRLELADLLRLRFGALRRLLAALLRFPAFLARVFVIHRTAAGRQSELRSRSCPTP